MKKIADNTIKFKLYSPIAAVMTGEKGLQTLTGADLLPYRDAIQAALDEVKESRVRFRATSNEQMQANQEKLRERRPASEQPQSDEDA